ncbi:hypothetical protein TNCV_4945822 [Trichonephila clavipes]|nr:hypothetical protein TNCV_4945822 [Trichonephila clavipes]
MLDLGQPISSNSSWQKKSGANGTSIILSRSHTSKLPMTQTHFERKMFDNISEIQRNVTRLLKCISKEDFLQSFQDMYCTSQGCIVMRGDYFEGDLTPILRGPVRHVRSYRWIDNRRHSSQGCQSTQAPPVRQVKDTNPGLALLSNGA